MTTTTPVLCEVCHKPIKDAQPVHDCSTDPPTLRYYHARCWFDALGEKLDDESTWVSDPLHGDESEPLEELEDDEWCQDA